LRETPDGALKFLPKWQMASVWNSLTFSKEKLAKMELQPSFQIFVQMPTGIGMEWPHFFQTFAKMKLLPSFQILAQFCKCHWYGIAPLFPNFCQIGIASLSSNFSPNGKWRWYGIVSLFPNFGQNGIAPASFQIFAQMADGINLIKHP